MLRWHRCERPDTRIAYRIAFLFSCRQCSNCGIVTEGVNSSVRIHTQSCYIHVTCFRENRKDTKVVYPFMWTYDIRAFDAGAYYECH